MQSGWPAQQGWPPQQPPQAGWLEQPGWQQQPSPSGASSPQPAAPGRYGDAAGEHLSTRRGRYSAWPHVVIAFIYQMSFVGVIAGAIAAVLVSLATDEPDVIGVVGLLVGAATGIPAAIFTFRDRWRTIEAVSSRYCAGMLNLSILYVPTIGWVYANIRAVQKLRGR